MSDLILVVDDNQDILNLYEALLADEGYQVSTHTSVPLDLALIKEIKPDLAILDLLFNNEDYGWQLIQKMKQERCTAHIPIILCTANPARIKPIEQQLEEKKIPVITKPFDLDELLFTTRNSLEASRYPVK